MAMFASKSDHRHPGACALASNRHQRWPSRWREVHPRVRRGPEANHRISRALARASAWDTEIPASAFSVRRDLSRAPPVNSNRRGRPREAAAGVLERPLSSLPHSASKTLQSSHPREFDPRPTSEIYGHLAPDYLQAEIGRLRLFRQDEAGELLLLPGSPELARTAHAQLGERSAGARRKFLNDSSGFRSARWGSRTHDLWLRRGRRARPPLPLTSNPSTNLGLRARRHDRLDVLDGPGRFGVGP
jgi:hypothetical protein